MFNSTRVVTENSMSLHINQGISYQDITIFGVDNKILYRDGLDELIFHALLGKLCCQDIDGKVIQTNEKAEASL